MSRSVVAVDCHPSDHEPDPTSPPWLALNADKLSQPDRIHHLPLPSGSARVMAGPDVVQTYSDSAFFYDPKNIGIPQHEQAHVQVRRPTRSLHQNTASNADEHTSGIFLPRRTLILVCRTIFPSLWESTTMG